METITMAPVSHIRHNGSPEGIAFAQRFNDATREYQERETTFVNSMVRFGCKIVTPDDGWVNRTTNILTVPSYARYKRKVGVGDLIALASHTRGFRIVRVIADRSSALISDRYEFDPVPVATGGPVNA